MVVEWWGRFSADLTDRSISALAAAVQRVSQPASVRGWNGVGRDGTISIIGRYLRNNGNTCVRVNTGSR